MTIEKGREWGELARVPHDVLVAADEARLAQVVGSHVRSGATRPLAVALVRGDLLTALGGAARRRVVVPRVGDACRLLPCDAYEVTISHAKHSTTTLAVSSVVIGSTTRPACSLTSGGFLGRLNVAPNSHPNDGRADALVWSTSNLRTLIAIRRRMRRGDHLPHPDLEMSRGAAVRWRAQGSSRRVVVDGRSYGRADAVAVTVRPDAFCLVVAAP
ncbi:MAG: hypothetical protein ACO3BU_03850 [Ilumatobacteraceae bacterium]